MKRYISLLMSILFILSLSTGVFAQESFLDGETSLGMGYSFSDIDVTSGKLDWWIEQELPNDWMGKIHAWSLGPLSFTQLSAGKLMADSGLQAEAGLFQMINTANTDATSLGLSGAVRISREYIPSLSLIGELKGVVILNGVDGGVPVPVGMASAGAEYAISDTVSVGGMATANSVYPAQIRAYVKVGL